MNVFSAFSGLGGLELGLERAGMTVVGQVEINEYCRRVLAKHWPEVPRHDDVRTCVDWWRSEPRPPVHVVAGGFPCQPVSVAGKGRAQADDRWVWPAMWAVIRDLRPDVAIMENVPGLLGRGIGDVLGDLAAGGYDAEWDCVPAAAVGAPHLRDRVFVVAHAQRNGVRLEPIAQPRRGRAAVASVDGARWMVADAASARRREDTGGALGDEGSDARPSTPHDHVSDCDGEGDRAVHVADADEQRRDERTRPRVQFAGIAEPSDGSQLANAGGARLEERRTFRPALHSGHWAVEPDVGRVPTGWTDLEP